MKVYESLVLGYNGNCAAVWLDNKNKPLNVNGYRSGWFRMVKDKRIFGISYKAKVGEEFCGIIVNDRVVEEKYDSIIYNRIKLS